MRKILPFEIVTYMPMRHTAAVKETETSRHPTLQPNCASKRLRPQITINILVLSGSLWLSLIHLSCHPHQDSDSALSRRLSRRHRPCHHRPCHLLFRPGPRSSSAGASQRQSQRLWSGLGAWSGWRLRSPLWLHAAWDIQLGRSPKTPTPKI